MVSNDSFSKIGKTKRQFQSPSNGGLRGEAPRPCTGVEALGPRALGPLHQTELPIFPIHLLLLLLCTSPPNMNLHFWLSTGWPACTLLTLFRPEENWDHFTSSCTTGRPVCPAPKELFNWHKSAESKKGKNRREERLKRCTFARALSLPPWAADLKSGPWEGPARPRGGAAQVQVQGGAALHLQSTCARCTTRPVPSELSWPAASQVLCSCRALFCGGFFPAGLIIIDLRVGHLLWPARHAFLGSAARHPDLNLNGNELSQSLSLIFTLKSNKWKPNIINYSGFCSVLKDVVFARGLIWKYRVWWTGYCS